MDSDDDFLTDGRSEKDGGGLASINIPAGHCLVHERWRSTSFPKELDKIMKVHHMGSMGTVDFQPAADVAVLYMSEGDLVCGLSRVKARLEEVAKVRRRRGGLKVICAFQKSHLTLPHLQPLQLMLLCHPSEASLVPVTDLSQLPQLLLQIFTANKVRNPFLASLESTKEKERARVDKDVLLAVCKLPKISMKEAKARKLLAKTESVRGIARARAPDLTSCLGDAKLAKGVESVFRTSSKI